MKHTAITIGPILKTLQSVKSTKAIWAVSYMFSHLMKEIISKAKLDQKDVLLPYFEKSDLTDKLGVGLFPDRLIFKKEVANIDNIINDVVEEFSKNVANDIEQDETDVKKFFKEYFTFHPITVDIKEDDNAIFTINNYLDTAELKQNTLSTYDIDYLIEFLENIWYNFLITEEFDNDKKRFPSTIEIAMAEFKEKNVTNYNKYVRELFKGKKEDDIDKQQLFIDKIRADDAYKKTYKNYQKYIAVVEADGDNIGAFIKQLYLEEKKEELIKRFSKHLLEFGKQAVQKIGKYQGTPIYAGGDDLLYFCPVAHTDFEKKVITKSYLTLIKEIDEIFKTLFNEDADFKPIIEKIDKKPSMSYGVSISYYKFPLNEALEQGANQLFGKAKQTKNKNAVAYAVQKHSGQQFGTIFHKDQSSFTTFEDLLKQHVSDENYLHGVVYKLEPQQKVFYSIGLITNDGERNTAFDNFFYNNFDESDHRVKGDKEKLIPFLEKLKQLFKDIYTENKVFDGSDDKAKEDINTDNLNKLYASLRFIGFIHNKEER